MTTDTQKQPPYDQELDKPASVTARWMMTCPTPPAEQTIRTAREIRLRFGFGGANFPGATDLYAAAEKIEAWLQEWQPE